MGSLHQIKILTSKDHTLIPKHLIKTTKSGKCNYYIGFIGIQP